MNDYRCSSVALAQGVLTHLATNILRRIDAYVLKWAIEHVAQRIDQVLTGNPGGCPVCARSGTGSTRTRIRWADYGDHGGRELRRAFQSRNRTASSFSNSPLLQGEISA